jgi:hypothetical protein
MDKSQPLSGLCTGATELPQVAIHFSREHNESACARFFRELLGKGQLEHRTENEKLTLIRLLRESDSDGSFQHHGACQNLVLTKMILRILLSLYGVVTNNPHLGGASSAHINELAAFS